MTLAALPTDRAMLIPWPLLLFAGAVLLYAGASLPTPANPGLVELSLGLLLLLAARFSAVVGAPVGGLLGAGGWLGLMGLALPLLIWLPALRGVLMGWAPADLVRDVLPLGFLFLPLVLAGRLPTQARTGLAGLFCAAAGILAGRFFIGVTDDAFGGRYLPLSPLLPFAVVYLAGVGLRGRLYWLPAILPVLIVCFAALLSTGQRAAVGLSLLVCGGLLLAYLPRRPVRVVVLLATLTGLGWWADWDGLAALGALADKWRFYGFNTRDAEWHLVLSLAVADWDVLLLGQGWGGVVEIPATPGLRVSFVHSFAAYLLLKCGLLGLVALFPLLWGLWRLWRQAWRCDRLIAVAAAVPLLIALTLHTTFKFPCFGFVLALLACCGGKETIAMGWPRHNQIAQTAPDKRRGATMEGSFWVMRPVLAPWSWPKRGVLAALVVVVAVSVLAVFWLGTRPAAYTAHMVVAPTVRDAAFPARILRDLPTVLRNIAPVAEDAPSDFTTFRHLLTSTELVRQLPVSLWPLLVPDEWDAARGWHPPTHWFARTKLAVEELFGRPGWAPPDAERIAAALDRRLVVETPGHDQLTILSLRDTDPQKAVALLTAIYETADTLVRKTALERGEAQSAYLRQRLVGEQNADHLEALGLLLVRQEQASMLYRINLPFAAQIIQPPTVPQRPDWPDIPLSLVTALIAALGLGCLAGIGMQMFEVRRAA